jgi:hypothetical protein
MGKITIKGATQVNRHSFKLYFCMFEKSQRKHNSLDCHNNFWNIFHCLHTCSKLGGGITCSKHSNPKSGQSLFFSNVLFFYQMYTIPFENKEDCNIDD